MGAATGLAALLAAGCALAEDTIKIGALLIDSGPLAGLKESQTKAINLAIEQINAAGGAAGKKLEPVFITYAGTPDTAVDGATRAVQKDGALFLTGMDTSAVSPALSAKLASLNALMVEVFAQADPMTGKGCNPNYFRANVNDSMLMNAVGDFLKDKPIKSWDIIAVDYSSGRDAAQKFQALVKSQGATIGKVLFAPSGTADFGAKISELGANPSEGALCHDLRQRRDQSRQAAGAIWAVHQIQDGDRQFFRDPAGAPSNGRCGARRLSDARFRSRRAGSAGRRLRESVQGTSTTANCPLTPPPTNMRRSSSWRPPSTRRIRPTSPPFALRCPASRRHGARPGGSSRRRPSDGAADRHEPDRQGSGRQGRV